MAGKRRDEIVETMHGTDERGAYTKYRYADGSVYTVRNFVRDTTVPENCDGKTYMERIAPQMVPFDEHLKRVGISKQEWWRRHEEETLSRFYNCEIRTTIVYPDEAADAAVFDRLKE